MTIVVSPLPAPAPAPAKPDVPPSGQFPVDSFRWPCISVGLTTSCWRDGPEVLVPPGGWKGQGSCRFGRAGACSCPLSSGLTESLGNKPHSLSK